MKITVKLFATLREGRQKIIDLDVEAGTTIEEIIDKMGIEKTEIAILLINGRDGQFDKILNESDLIAIFPPVGGG